MMSPAPLTITTRIDDPAFSFNNPIALKSRMSDPLNSVIVPRVEPPLAPKQEFAFDSMEDALTAFRQGEFVVVMDDESRENEGDLIIAADAITTEKMAWFIKVTSGYICIAMPGEALERLDLPLMVTHNTETYRTAYTITVDYSIGTTTGISAHDRALTARKLAKGAPAHEFTRPGHMVPLRARDGGVLTRKGHTESAVDLCRLTGRPHAGLLCELVNDDPQGTMARRDDCRKFANKHGLKMISVEMIVNYIQSLEASSTVPGMNGAAS